MSILDFAVIPLEKPRRPREKNHHQNQSWNRNGFFTSLYTNQGMDDFWYIDSVPDLDDSEKHFLPFAVVRKPCPGLFLKSFMLLPHNCSGIKDKQIGIECSLTGWATKACSFTVVLGISSISSSAGGSAAPVTPSKTGSCVAFCDSKFYTCFR